MTILLTINTGDIADIGTTYKLLTTVNKNLYHNCNIIYKSYVMLQLLMLYVKSRFIAISRLSAGNANFNALPNLAQPCPALPSLAQPCPSPITKELCA